MENKSIFFHIWEYDKSNKNEIIGVLNMKINLKVYILRIYSLKNKLNILIMSNMFFCKEGTKIIEVTCGHIWPFFDVISKILNLNHVKCCENNFDSIIKCIE